MARWLVTVDASVDPASLRQRLARLAIEAAVADEVVPLGESEQVVSVESEEDLCERLEGVELIRGVHPDSEMTLYGGPMDSPVF